MNELTRPRRVEIIPPSAPFSQAQRSWLNGFFAGLLADDAARSRAPERIAQTPPGPGEDDDDAPWHDETLPIAERMRLADGRPLRRRMMAALAQQDCGQCGYNCRDYSNAIADKSEARLNLCAPGGKQTARLLKTLCEELDRTVATTRYRDATAPPAALPAGVTEPGRSRDAPVEAIFVGRRLLNKKGSAKQTYHIDLELAAPFPDYAAGDCLGVFAHNDLGLVDQIIALLGVSHTTRVNGKTLREALTREVSLSPAPDRLFELISFISGGALREKARALAQGEDPDGDAATLDVMAALQKLSAARPHPEAFVEALEPLQPRLYSISSSRKATPGKVSLTVDCVRYAVGKRQRLGVASSFLAERINPGDKLKAYVQKAHDFGLPQDPKTPIIMVGPGTGIAPFRAFLLDRKASGATGKGWLFFGHQHSEYDFFYSDELNALKASGQLTRMSLAWSRDGAKKFYVQDRMREVGREVWTWLAEGAHFYICGDATRMAKDVERALTDIVAQHGARSIDEAVAFVSELKRTRRFQKDVY